MVWSSYRHRAWTQLVQYGGGRDLVGVAVVQQVLRVPVQTVDGLRSAEAVVTADDGFRGKVNDCW